MTLRHCAQSALLLQADELHDARELRVFPRDETAELLGGHEGRTHAQLLAGLNEIGALRGPFDRPFEDRDGGFFGPLRSGDAAPGLVRDVVALLAIPWHIYAR